MDYFCEQNVDNPQIDKHKKRTVILGVVSKILLVLGIIIIFFMLGFGVDISQGALNTVIGFAFGIMMGMPFILSYILIRRFLRKSNLEYDYILNGSVFRVIKVIMRNKRKLLCTVPVGNIESMGRVTCDAYERYAAGKTAKKQFALCEYEDDNDVVYMSYRSDGENYLLHFQPNEEMIGMLRRSLPRIGIIDKSLNMPAVKK